MPTAKERTPITKGYKPCLKSKSHKKGKETNKLSQPKLAKKP